MLQMILLSRVTLEQRLAGGMLSTSFIGLEYLQLSLHR
jgi:hypothetical protein